MSNTPHKQQFAAKRGVASPRLVRMLGADARLAQNDEPDEEIDRGPLTQPAELTEEAFQQADLEYLRSQQQRDARRLADTVQAELTDFRARGIL